METLTWLKRLNSYLIIIKKVKNVCVCVGGGGGGGGGRKIEESEEQPTNPNGMFIYTAQ